MTENYAISANKNSYLFNSEQLHEMYGSLNIVLTAHVRISVTYCSHYIHYPLHQLHAYQKLLDLESVDPSERTS
jgi:hypothetical protein